ncbi:NnrU family protein [Erythrobacter sp. JK5]|uniref:NnrU family protein n=1 Tax=Erythrobacter sp. JK5 TaxID=2829500 RepID=UPI001BA9511B|nr:NnrU family protein [Erythrobacter sp. JK5]QUL37170.1 MFS transporter [Erythrobacter sp. JK5]
MNGALIELTLANGAFVGSHFLMSHSLRRPMVRVLGDIGFQVVYSLISIALLAWVYFAFTAAPPSDLAGTGDLGWAIATVLILPALVLFAGSMVGNPALGLPGSESMARAEPKGVFRITRHPMMWGFALWALSHMALLWSWRTMITAFAMGVLALIGAHLQDRKKERLMGEAWMTWENSTSFWPRWTSLHNAGALAWTVGLILFVFLSWLHMPLGGVPAGIWRWF